MQANPVNFDYSQSALIKSPFEDLKNKEIQRKYTRVVIDSRDRDTTLFPTPASYEMELDTDIEEVTSVELLLADVPLTSYALSASNNQLLVRVGGPAAGTEYTITIPPGDHNPPSLASALQTELAAAIPSQTFSVSHSLLTNRITTSCDAEFAFLPSPNTVLKALGIPAAGLSSTATTSGGPLPNVLDPPFRVNLMDNRYVVMNVQQLSLNTSSNSVLHKSFAVLGKNTIVNYHNATSKVIKHLNPPIARLTKLRITFTDYYGNPYDFQNHDHRIELLFESRKHLLRFM